MRRKVLGITIPPWYQVIPLGLFIISNCEFAVVMNIAEILSRASSDGEGWRIEQFGVIVWASLIGVCITWSLWVLPWFASADIDYQSSQPPKAVACSLLTMMFLPSLMGWIFGLGLAAMFVAFHVVVTSVHQNVRRAFPIGWGIGIVAVVILAATLPLLWVIPLSRRIRQRVRDTARRRQVCFACGYDLRGNPEAACPECGHHDAGDVRLSAHAGYPKPKL